MEALRPVLKEHSQPEQSGTPLGAQEKYDRSSRALRAPAESEWHRFVQFLSCHDALPKELQVECERNRETVLETFFCRGCKRHKVRGAERWTPQVTALQKAKIPRFHRGRTNPS